MFNLLSRLNKYVSFGSLKQLALRPRLLVFIPLYLRQLRRYRQMERGSTGSLSSLRIYPCLGERRSDQGVGHYFYQNSWAAHHVFLEKPSYIVDVGSAVQLVGILSQFRPCISVDIRSVRARLAGLVPCSGSLLALPFADNTVPCLTTMCVLEHIGLGRYGDPLDPHGTTEAGAEISRVVAPGGIVIYSVPVGRSVTEFNAHRRFTYEEASGIFHNWELVDSAVLIPCPVPYTCDGDLMQFRDAVACFCLRKPSL